MTEGEPGDGNGDTSPNGVDARVRAALAEAFVALLSESDSWCGGDRLAMLRAVGDGFDDAGAGTDLYGARRREGAAALFGVARVGCLDADLLAGDLRRLRRDPGSDWVLAVSDFRAAVEGYPPRRVSSAPSRRWLRRIVDRFRGGRRGAGTRGKSSG